LPAWHCAIESQGRAAPTRNELVRWCSRVYSSRSMCVAFECFSENPEFAMALLATPLQGLSRAAPAFMGASGLPSMSQDPLWLAENSMARSHESIRPKATLRRITTTREVFSTQGRTRRCRGTFCLSPPRELQPWIVQGPKWDIMGGSRGEPHASKGISARTPAYLLHKRAAT
jgi:hypothetical protein